MMLLLKSFFLLFLIHLNAVECLFSWELRTLICEKYECQLLKEPEGLKPAECRIEDSRHICDIQCDGADRDSVISKNPTVFRPCSRFYTYNTKKASSGKWFIWRDSACADSNITFSVHCAFPYHS